jgi:hypothetical protein
MNIVGSGTYRTLGAVATALLMAACFGSSTNFDGGSLLASNDDVRLPERKPTPRSRDDAGTTTKSSTEPRPGEPTPTPPTAPATDAGTGADAAVDAAPPRSAFCSAPDLILCFELEGMVKDGSVNAVPVTSVTNVSFVQARTGQGVEVGNDSAIHLPYTPLLDAQAVTIEAWVRLSTDLFSGGVIFDADGRYAMEIENDGDLKCITPDGSETGGSVADGVLTHVACTFASDGRIRNYVAGEERDIGSGRLGTSDTGGAEIGGDAPSGERFVGTIDQLRVFRRVLTPEEIALSASAP